MKPEMNTQKLAIKIDAWLIRQTRPFTWKDIYDKIGIDLDEPWIEMGFALKYLVSKRRIRVVTPPNNLRIHYQHVIDEEYEWPEQKTDEEDIEECPDISPCPFMADPPYCGKCPVYEREVKTWKEIPCPECGVKPMKHLGTTLMIYCPNCGHEIYHGKKEDK